LPNCGGNLFLRLPQDQSPARTRKGSTVSLEARQLKKLERENTRLKLLVAEQALDLATLKEAAEGNF
jgi:hypothetical protein